MSLASQRSVANKTSNTTTDQLVSPVASSELADYLGMDYSSSDHAILNSHLLTACGWYIAHMNNELLQRSWRLKLDRYPTQGDSFGGLSPIYANLLPWIDIPLYPVASIDSVTVDTVTETVTSDLDSKPPRVLFTNYGNNIEINYTAGYLSASDIPASVILGINMMAGYLYEHRGACGIENAAKESGAISVWGYNAMILSL
jgi:hypothetical protein